ncbi:M23 family metallopeptidase [Methylocystis sp. MJC1]|jgi:murein DD-endopeptidase MepM/ murein hydrolase activator NlpD|uniref:M23 family metallopeptidase n=1 Tax=Methylocystis sp. MJC1 TaxID=2654282 RepID=UPI0013EA180F|nr:M23 family metallopeptidase [Methylocystis sp. MJC1]KAF2989071.1 Murein DD-endopeptidase MepM [Methylocystis sp. MJC1]MBU6527870.1 M23 family metallopeptidase [Methylocystis sp. MJC1]UZX10791.1 M23 family metallopeptidase [Methylocystis sp. MJC1]
MGLQFNSRLASASGSADWRDIGEEPAIEVDGRRHTADDRRRVSARWLSGTVLTGFSGALLISAAAYTALDQQTRFAEAPQRAQAARQAESEGNSVNPKKGDRLMRAVDVVAAKQTFRAATTSKSGDKEVVRTRAFTHVAATLTLAPTSFANEVPAYNPLKLASDPRAPENSGESDIALDEAEVSFVTKDLSGLDIQSQSAHLSIDEAQAQVNEQVKSSLAAGPKPALPLPGQLLLSRTSRAAAMDPQALAYATPGTSLTAPFSSIEVRMVPENVTIAPRDTPQPTQMEEKLAVVRRSETLEDILVANGVPRARIAAVVAAYRGKRDPVREGQRVKLLFADFDGSGKNMQLARLSVYNDDEVESIVAANDQGAFVQTPTAPSGGARRAQKRAPVDDFNADGEDDDSGAMRLYDSLYETALKQQIPKTVVGELVRIFANDVDLQRGVAGGDSLDIFYDEPEDGSGPTRDSLLYASLTTHSETYRYYRFQTPDDGLVDYYDENGRSSRKFLVRKPISIGETRSGFGMRRHPILGYYKMHTGVDWAAPIGTPILAAGNGTVIKAQWDSGYGRRVEIQHANGYITTYNHMSGFARGVSEGVRVKQGQVVGFLGSTGLSTGPHLHYEVMVNGHFVDPMRVKLARTREIEGRMLADFKRERDRVDSLMAKAPNSNKVAAQGATASR